MEITVLILNLNLTALQKGKGLNISKTESLLHQVILKRLPLIGKAISKSPIFYALSTCC